LSAYFIQLFLIGAIRPMKESWPGGHRNLTCSAVWPTEGYLCAVAGVPAPLFHTSPSIMADAVTCAVTRAA